MFTDGELGFCAYEHPAAPTKKGEKPAGTKIMHIF